MKFLINKKALGSPFYEEQQDWIKDNYSDYKTCRYCGGILDWDIGYCSEECKNLDSVWRFND
jgi:hypothetical protein